MMKTSHLPAVNPTLATEVCLTALTLSAVIGLTHLFTSNSYLVVTITAAITAHVLALATRRLNLSVPTTLAVGVVGLVLAISWLVLPSTTFIGIPTLATISQAGEELSRAWQTFQLVVAPAPMLPGFVLSIVVGAWLIAFVADIAAFRANAPIEAAAPAGALFVFGAVLGQANHVSTHRITTALFLIALVSYWLVQQIIDQGIDQTKSTSKSTLITGGLIGIASITFALIVGPLIPGMDNNAIIPWRDGDLNKPDSRVTVSPLVDIRTRLVDQSNLEVFSVKSEARSYWRLTSLERFDGQIWSSEGRYNKTSGKLPITMSPTEPTADKTVTQQFTIAELSSIWLPAAFQPTAIKGTQARFDPTSSSLLTDSTTTKGLSYEVTSTLTTLNQADLRTSPPPTPSAANTTYLMLPDNFSPRLRAEARKIVAKGTTAYDQARLLQDYFRSPRFTYDLDVQPGHTGNLLENFVFETRRGYCEQFAGVYAAMARSIGLPARVAVGFTPGEQSSDGTFLVRGSNGHAWPEVYLAGYGWVAFEPTPGRGIPNGESYTGVPEQQASSGEPSTATTLAPTTTTTAPNVTETTPTTMPTVPNPKKNIPSPWRMSIMIFAAAVVLIASWVSGIAALTHLRRQRRRADDLSPENQVLNAWAEAGESLSWLTTRRHGWETPLEYAHRVVATTTIDPSGVIGLATLATTASYSAGETGGKTGTSLDVQMAWDSGEHIRHQVISTLSKIDRAKLLVDPRPLLSSFR